MTKPGRSKGPLPDWTDDPTDDLRAPSTPGTTHSDFPVPTHPSPPCSTYTSDTSHGLPPPVVSATPVGVVPSRTDLTTDPDPLRFAGWCPGVYWCTPLTGGARLKVVGVSAFQSVPGAVYVSTRTVRGLPYPAVGSGDAVGVWELMDAGRSRVWMSVPP